MATNVAMFGLGDFWQAEASHKSTQQTHDDSITAAIEPAGRFYPAEEVLVLLC